MNKRSLICLFLLLQVCLRVATAQYTFMGGPLDAVAHLHYFNDTLWAGTQHGLAISVNEGDTWSVFPKFQNTPIEEMHQFGDSVIVVRVTEKSYSTGNKHDAVLWRKLRNEPFKEVARYNILSQPSVTSAYASATLEPFYKKESILSSKITYYPVHGPGGSNGIASFDAGRTFQYSALYSYVAGPYLVAPDVYMVWNQWNYAYFYHADNTSAQGYPNNQLYNLQGLSSLGADLLGCYATDGVSLMWSGNFGANWESQQIPNGLNPIRLIGLGKILCYAQAAGYYEAALQPDHSFTFQPITNPSQVPTTPTGQPIWAATPNRLYFFSGLDSLSYFAKSDSQTYEAPQPPFRADGTMTRTDAYLYYKTQRALYRSADGVQWQRYADPQLPDASGFNQVKQAIFSNNGTTQVRSIDNGLTWQTISLPNNNALGISLGMISNRYTNAIYYGKHVSHDLGNTWTDLGVQVTQAFGDTLLTAYGISVNHGQTWVAHNGQQAGIGQVYGTILSPHDPRLLRVNWPFLEGSNDFGQTWLPQQQPAQQVFEVNTAYIHMWLQTDRLAYAHIGENMYEIQLPTLAVRAISLPNTLRGHHAAGYYVRDYGTFTDFKGRVWYGGVSGVYQRDSCVAQVGTLPSVRICSGDSVQINGAFYSTAQTVNYIQGLMPCLDSFSLNIEVLPRVVDTLPVTYFCRNQGITYQNIYYSFSTNVLSPSLSGQQCRFDLKPLVQRKDCISTGGGGQPKVALAEPTPPHFIAYPNPVSETLFIEAAAEAVGHIMLLDALGREVSRADMLDRFVWFDVSALRSGMYIWRWFGAESVAEGKVIIE
jgi:hypothetical protein